MPLTWKPMPKILERPYTLPVLASSGQRSGRLRQLPTANQTILHNNVFLLAASYLSFFIFFIV
jgi:hypothetical protein